MEGFLEKKRRGFLSKGYVTRYFHLQHFTLLVYKRIQDRVDNAPPSDRIGMQRML